MKILFIMPLVILLHSSIFASITFGQLGNTGLRVQEIGNGNFDKGLNHIVSLARKGNGTATMIYALLNREIGKTNDFLKYLTISANQGNSVAMKFLGTGYFKGALVKQDYDKARFWFEKSAKYRNINSMMYLGIIHRDGLGVEPNIKTSYFWFTVAGILKPIAEGQNEPRDFARVLEKGLLSKDIQSIAEDAHAWVQLHPKIEPQKIPILK
jgi:hypothetical protein